MSIRVFLISFLRITAIVNILLMCNSIVMSLSFWQVNQVSLKLNIFVAITQSHKFADVANVTKFQIITFHTINNLLFLIVHFTYSRLCRLIAKEKINVGSMVHYWIYVRINCSSLYIFLYFFFSLSRNFLLIFTTWIVSTMTERKEKECKPFYNTSCALYSSSIGWLHIFLYY